MERLTFVLAISPDRSGACGSKRIVASEPLAPARDAKHGGTRTNRISARASEGGDQSQCNSLGGNTKIFWKCLLGADPRNPRERPARPNTPVVPPADEYAPDTGGSDSDGRSCSAPWPDTAVGHARHANAGPPAGRPYCNSASADALVGTASRTPSTSKADAADDAGQALEPGHTPGHAEVGPREVPTPERSSRGAERLFRSATPFTPWPSLLHLPTHNHSNRHQPIAPRLPWSRESGSLLRRPRQSVR